MNVKDAGRKGGETSRNRGANYVELGRSGGIQTLRRYGKEHYQEMGRRSGERRRVKPCATCGNRSFHREDTRELYFIVCDNCREVQEYGCD